MTEPRQNGPSVPNYRLYREKSGESGEFWIHCETIPVRTHLHNWEITPHRHAALFQLFHLTQGAGELIGGGAGMRFAAPCAIYVAPAAVHGFRFSRAIDGLVVTAVADRLEAPGGTDRGIAAFLRQTRIVQLADDDPDAAAFGHAVDIIQREMRAPKPGHDLYLEAQLLSAVVALARADGAAPDKQDGPDVERMRRLDTLISAHFREQRPVAFYAERLGLSPAHLNRLSRRHFGRSLSGLVAHRTMETARRDLVFTPTPIQAVAYSLGFADPAYFNRFFRRHAGTTPGAFREAERRRLARP